MDTNYLSKIRFYKILAFVLVGMGFLTLIFGTIVLIIDIRNPLMQISFLSRLSDLGQFFSGTVAAFWALAGLIFIYIGFLHQQYELVLQRMKESEEIKQRELDIIQERKREVTDEINTLKSEYKSNLKSFKFREYNGLRALDKLYVTLRNKYHENIKEPFDYFDAKVNEEQHDINMHRYYMQVRNLIKNHLEENGELRKNLLTLSKFLSLVVNSDANVINDKSIHLHFFSEELAPVEKLYFFYYMWLVENINLKSYYNNLKMYQSLNEDVNLLLNKDDLTIFITPSK